MRIAIDISQIAYEDTGVANYTKGLVTSLLGEDGKNSYVLFAYSLRKMGVIKDFLKSLKARGAEFEVRLFNFPQSIARVLWNNWHLLKLENLLGKIDIYHSSDWIQIPASARKVTTVHDLVVYKYPQTSDPVIVRNQKKRMEWVIKECDLILADSHSTKKDICEILGVEKQRIKVVYPGIDDSFYSGSKDSGILYKKYGVEYPFILAVGTNDPRKNLKRVIAAYESLLRSKTAYLKEPLPQLLIISKNGWGEELKSGGNIQVLKSVLPEDLPEFYSGARCLVYPSLYEGFGLPVIEAMASGCPVITSDRGSLSEIADGSSLVVDPENETRISGAILKLLKDSALRNSLIKKGKARAGHFTWDNAVGHVLNAYEGLNRK